MMQIISSEFRFGWLICFKEAFNEEKVAYEKTKVGGWRGKWFVV
jgi:hypothetical protein